MTTATGRFLFDRDFDGEGPDGPGGDPRKRVQYTEEDMNRAREQATAEGFQSGQAQAHISIEEEASKALDIIGQRLGDIDARQDNAVRGLYAEASKLAWTIANKLAAELIAQQPLAELEAMIADCLKHLPTEPRVVLRVAEPLLDQLQPRMDIIATEAGFSGSIVLIGETDLGMGDCRVEWADGGAERNFEATCAAIEDTVERYFQAETEAVEEAQAAFDFSPSVAPEEPASPVVAPPTPEPEPAPTEDAENDAASDDQPPLQAGS